MSRELVLLARIAGLARDPGVRLEDFEQGIAASPRLAAEVVRVANSALYGMEGRIHQLRRAVLILGTENVTRIAAAILAGRELRAGGLGRELGEALWLHSLRVAVCSELLARSLGLRVEAEAHLVGLLHELGVPVLYRAHGPRYAELLERADPVQPLEQREAEALGDTHARRVAAQMVEWGFPEQLRDAAAFHHAPDSAPEVSRPLAALVHAAHAVIAGDRAGFADGVGADRAESVLTGLGLYPDDAEDVRAELEVRLKQLTAVL